MVENNIGGDFMARRRFPDFLFDQVHQERHGGFAHFKTRRNAAMADGHGIGEVGKNIGEQVADGPIFDVEESDILEGGGLFPFLSVG